MTDNDVAAGRRSVPISALEHYAYCPRQAALIHVEAYFNANVDTVRGELAHAAVDRAGAGQNRRRHPVWRSLPVWSAELGVHGVCDVVEFNGGPTPIEHKSGGYRPGGPADVQVAAQALCLREMFNAAVPLGVVFSGRDRRRHDVIVDTSLAALVADTTTAVRRLLDLGAVPQPVHDARCRRCSLRPGCIPEAPTRVAHSLFEPRNVGTWEWDD
ncbi:CRISPR-associated protein Cas4 [Lentzea terrae]|uniref:CRISPR-associated protein Cas4 n=1 Tax=Lentzea terrae TaxID=2200761 RepID=UPI000DD38864|nr:CRISPR-associated protein Cas4 [Lentzea terrae]